MDTMYIRNVCIYVYFCELRIMLFMECMWIIQVDAYTSDVIVCIYIQIHVSIYV